MKTDLTKMLIAKLKSHPLQPDYFGNCTSADDADLATDLRLRGQLTPLVVMPAQNAAGLPAGTILDGHRRASLMAANGQTKVVVVVRDDLKDADATTVEAEFLKYNFRRRQLHPLDKARVARRLFEIERGRKRGGLDRNEELASRDRVGKALGMSGRHLERYCRVLETPLKVQNAVRDGRLGVVAGARVALLEKGVQLEFAACITGKTDPDEIKRIAMDYVNIPNNDRHEKTGDALAALARFLAKSLTDLGDRVEKVSPRSASRYLEVLDQSKRMIDLLVQRAKAYKPEIE